MQPKLRVLPVSLFLSLCVRALSCRGRAPGDRCTIVLRADEQSAKGGNAAAGLSARITEIGAEQRGSTDEGDGGANLYACPNFR